MTGIGNTVETDLVGELVEVRERQSGQGYYVAGGRVRAVTTAADGLNLWLEAVERPHDTAFSGTEIGDVVVVSVGIWSIIRLIRRSP